MAKKGSARATTLSISLPGGLARHVAERVESGLYGSASELVREALRLLLRTEEAERDWLDRVEPGASMVAETARSSLDDWGRAMRRLPKTAAARERLRRLQERRDTGPGLRISPERLEKLKRRDRD